MTRGCLPWQKEEDLDDVLKEKVKLRTPQGLFLCFTKIERESSMFKKGKICFSSFSRFSVRHFYPSIHSECLSGLTIVWGISSFYLFWTNSREQNVSKKLCTSMWCLPRLLYSQVIKKATFFSSKFDTYPAIRMNMSQEDYYVLTQNVPITDYFEYFHEEFFLLGHISSHSLLNSLRKRTRRSNNAISTKLGESNFILSNSGTNFLVRK